MIKTIIIRTSDVTLALDTALSVHLAVGYILSNQQKKDGTGPAQ
jgi:hypothetical protein